MPLLADLSSAAKRSAETHEAEAERLRNSPDWQPRWKAEQKARTARLLCQAIEEITSEGNNNEDRNHGA